MKDNKVREVAMISSMDKYILGPVTDKMREELVKQIRERVEFTCHCLIRQCFTKESK